MWIDSRALPSSFTKCGASQSRWRAQSSAVDFGKKASGSSAGVDSTTRVTDTSPIFHLSMAPQATDGSGAPPSGGVERATRSGTP